MTRIQLEHIIRASGAIADSRRLVIIGSQAILGSHPDAPPELLVSMEADVYPPDDIERADLIDGSIGEDSIFHETFGYYAHGIGPETAQLPAEWRSRLVKVQNKNTEFIEGLCLSPVDLAVSKLLAGRTKDASFVKTMLAHGMVTLQALREVSSELPDTLRNRLLSAIAHL